MLHILCAVFNYMWCQLVRYVLYMYTFYIHIFICIYIYIYTIGWISIFQNFWNAFFVILNCQKVAKYQNTWLHGKSHFLKRMSEWNYKNQKMYSIWSWEVKSGFKRRIKVYIDERSIKVVFQPQQKKKTVWKKKTRTKTMF